MTASVEATKAAGTQDLAAIKAKYESKPQAAGWSVPGHGKAAPAAAAADTVTLSKDAKSAASAQTAANTDKATSTPAQPKSTAVVEANAVAARNAQLKSRAAQANQPSPASTARAANYAKAQEDAKAALKTVQTPTRQQTLDMMA